MSITPEGKVKNKVRAVLAEFSEHVEIGGLAVKTLKQFWPVPSGIGASDIDCIVCFRGQYISIEVKRPGKKPTPRQELTLAETRGAGGYDIVIATEDDVILLRQMLQHIKVTHANDR